MSKARETAREFLALCEDRGWTPRVRGSILEITKSFTPESLDEFSRADSEYYDILSIIPRSRPGSTWGTDGGGIGGLTAIRTGLFTMKMSGGNKRVLNAIQKELA